MIYLLDTNVLSEMMKPQSAEAVATWIRSRSLSALFTASICCAEILAGIAILPAGRRRSELDRVAKAIFEEDFGGRTLPFDERAAVAYAEILAKRRAKGRPIATADLIVAATAQTHRAMIVTRNISDFEYCGIGLIDPWTAGFHP